MTFSSGGKFALVLSGLLNSTAGATIDLAEAATIEAAYVADTIANVSGGKERDTVALGELEAAAELDGEALGLPGSNFGVRAQLHHGGVAPSDIVGDAQGLSNLEAERGLMLVEAWADIVLSPSTALKGGLVDLNSEFEVHHWGNLFWNSSHEVGPEFSQSGSMGPSLTPNTAVGAIARWSNADLDVRVGVFDDLSTDSVRGGRPMRFPGTANVLVAGELEFALTGSAKVHVGTWHYTGRYDVIAATTPADNPRRIRAGRGAYVMLEGELAGDAETGLLDGWVRYGRADDRVHPIGSYVGGGLQYGTAQSRGGIAFAHARLGDPARAASLSLDQPSERAETSIELAWRRAVTDRIAIQPAAQYIVNPGWDRSTADALVVGVRLELTLL